MKKLINDERWKPILMLLGNIAILEWIIFPGLTVASSFINMIAILGFIALFLYDLNYVKETWFTISEEEKLEEAKWKAEIERKQNELRDSLPNFKPTPPPPKKPKTKSIK